MIGRLVGRDDGLACRHVVELGRLRIDLDAARRDIQQLMVERDQAVARAAEAEAEVARLRRDTSEVLRAELDRLHRLCAYQEDLIAHNAGRPVHNRVYVRSTGEVVSR